MTLRICDCKRTRPRCADHEVATSSSGQPRGSAGGRQFPLRPDQSQQAAELRETLVKSHRDAKITRASCHWNRSVRRENAIAINALAAAPIANQQVLADGEAVRGLLSLRRVRTNASRTGPARTGRYSCVRGTRCVFCQDIRLPYMFFRVSDLIVKRCGGATAATPERQQKNGGEHNSDEEPKSRGDLHICRTNSYHGPVADNSYQQ